jgi:hypothetical protein
MSVNPQELHAVRAKQAAIFNEKESTCLKRKHDTSQEQTCGVSEAPNQGYKIFTFEQYISVVLVIQSEMNMHSV